MKKFFRIILWVVLIGLIIIQFFRPVKNVSAKPSDKNIAALYAAPPDVVNILKKACTDCHSNNTVYPWYANIQPVAWWLNDHIEDGKDELNLDEFGNYRLRKQYHKLEEIADQVKEGEMPLTSYTFIHTNAKLNDVERKKLLDWTSSLRQFMEQHYPPDSLAAKK